MSLVTQARKWLQQGRLDQAMDDWCNVLQGQLLTRQKLRECFLDMVPMFAAIASRNRTYDIGAEEFSEFIHRYCQEHRIECAEVCLRILEDKHRDPADLLSDADREMHNRKWQQLRDTDTDEE